ncbi:MAG: hypothetical protein QW700_07985 [Desulfurococcaceae archaeon]|uniref:hypothetical protein n=1 Tax=Pyrobaculum sp. TaxID=2004705 RepID=UPI00315FC671
MTQKTSLYVYASPLREWNDFTDAHAKARELSEEALRQFKSLVNGDSEEAPPLIIVGGLGSGKTQLIYHLFKLAWQKLELPALYTNLRAVLAGIRNRLLQEGKDKISPDDLVRLLREFSLEKLRNISEFYDKGDYELSVFWLPEIPGMPSNISPRKFFTTVLKSDDKVLEVINRVRNRKFGIVLFIDEVEMAFREFRELLEGGLRDFMEKIGQGTGGIYVVMAVSYLSYYELFLSQFIGDAFHRRSIVVTIPPVSPDVLHEMLRSRWPDVAEKSNTLWWLTRGRLGWLTHLKGVVYINDKNISELLSWWEKPHLREQLAENLPVIDIEEL